ncbi:uncharacterized protein LOC120185262 [Hibiscus syriacus]|uniref:uncharacterized protein LOC120185247 n=1 Tax=Hibiscus syriacus TaxID=106335 RepID=UPI001924B4B5|nr:uncharacterized protein LOC120185247 [Hibiscus syriacus]XP_039045460.1 uncharacterized protein LOC120185262 [Hibiscus syriacus]
MEFPSIAPVSELCKVVGRCLESGESSTCAGKVEVQNGQEVNLNQSTRQNLPEVRGEAMAFPSMPCVSGLHMECVEPSSECHNSDKFASGNVSFPSVCNFNLFFVFVQIYFK